MFFSAEEFKGLSQQTKVYLDDAQFYPRIYSQLVKIVKKRHSRDRLSRLLLHEYEDLSRHIENTPLQNASIVRNNIRVCRLASFLIDKSGDFDEQAMDKTAQVLTDNLYCLGPGRQVDGRRREHILQVIEKLRESKEVRTLFKRINKPIMNKRAEDLFRDVLRLDKKEVITNANARQAVLASWMTFLRQNVGSCFATAPAILILHEQPEKFLDDIKHLIDEGRIKRTFAGNEYMVPLSSSWGKGDLKRAFAIYREDTNIWQSPGMISAFEAAGVIERGCAYAHKVKVIKGLLQKSFDWLYQGQPAFITSADVLIRQALMVHNNITEAELADYQNKKSGLLQHTLMMQAAQIAQAKEDKNGCEVFLKQHESATSIFKALTDNALLKAWEFSLASFSETKAQFAQWNLYASLGLNPEEPYGIGNVIYNIVKERLDHHNGLVNEYQEIYKQKFLEVKHAEARLRTGGDDMEWLSREYEHRTAEMEEIIRQRDIAHSKARRTAGMFKFIIERYEEKFKEYFQEVYDAEMFGYVGNEYDDTPAGFRLLYKHGRPNTSLWTMIYHPQEFIDYLADFFMSTEREIVHDPELEGLEDDVSSCVTEIVRMVKTREFLEASLYRMAAAHNSPIPDNPLENLEKVEKKPWVYVSGGTMNSLVTCYYHKEQAPTEEQTLVASPKQLLSFFIDTVRQMPDNVSSLFVDSPQKRLLMHSPTHAFNFMPGLKPFCDSWQGEEGSSQWINDNAVRPAQDLIYGITLGEYEMGRIIEELSEVLPRFLVEHFKALFSHLFPMSPRIFRDHIIKTVLSSPLLQVNGHPVIPEDDIDSILYRVLPFTNTDNLRENLAAIFSAVKEDLPDVMKIFDLVAEDVHRYHFISAQRLREICLSLIMMSKGSVTSSIDWYYVIAEAMQKTKFAMPMPIIVADTNWVKDYFGFVVNPGTEELDFWRLDYAGTSGGPMSVWKQWLDGSYDGPRSWGIYTNPAEFR
jgi:hypothetical protein